MKIFTERLTVFFIVITLLIVACPVAYATEINEPPTGDLVKLCYLSFRVGYIPPPEDPFKGDIAVIMTDIATNKEYQFLLIQEKGFNGNELYQIPANTTYKVKLSYPNMDRFKVVNSDGSEIDSYHATESGLDLSWSIKELEVNNSSDKTINNAAASSQEDGDNDYINLTGSEMVDKFTKETSFIENNSDYKQFIGSWAGAVYKKQYLEIEGNTEESWNAMTEYQRACYSLLFTYPKVFVLGKNSDKHTKDRSAFIKNIEFEKQALSKIKNGEIVYNALEKAWDWHWNNWETKRTFVNPFEGTKYGVGDKEKTTSTGEFELTQDEKNELIDSVQENKKVEPTKEEKREELSNPKNFLNILKGNFITILILLGLGVAIIVVMIRNKSYRNSKD